MEQKVARKRNSAQRIKSAFSRTKVCVVRHKKISGIIGLIFVYLVFCYSRTVLHVTKEFLLHGNFNIKICKHFHHSFYDDSTPPVQIPKIIHQIFFNLSDNRIEFMKKYQPYQQTWKDLNPDHQYILWNATMIDKLVNESYQEIKPIYEKYKHKWVVRADIARYLVVHQMGGVYADMDVMCKRSMNDLYKQIGTKSVVLNYTYNPVGISNDFFAAGAKHEFMEHVIDGLEEADVLYLTPYINTMFRTGPMFMLGRYLNYPHPNDIYLIPQTSIHTFIDSSDHGQSWYSFDGMFIAVVWNGVSPLQLISVILMVIFIYRLNKLIKIRKTLAKRPVKRQLRYYNYDFRRPIPEFEEI